MSGHINNGEIIEIVKTEGFDKKIIDEGWYNNTLIYAGFPRPGDFVLDVRGHYEEQNFKIKKNGWYNIIAVAGGPTAVTEWFRHPTGYGFDQSDRGLSGSGGGYSIITYLKRGNYRLVVGDSTEDTLIQLPTVTYLARCGNPPVSYQVSGSGGICSLPDSTLENTYVEEWVSNGNPGRNGLIVWRTSGGVYSIDMGNHGNPVYKNWGSGGPGGMSIQFLGKNWTTDRSLQINITNGTADFYYNDELVASDVATYTYTKPIRTVGNIRVQKGSNIIRQIDNYAFVYQQSPQTFNYTYFSNGVADLGDFTGGTSKTFYIEKSGDYRIDANWWGNETGNTSIIVNLSTGAHTIRTWNNRNIKGAQDYVIWWNWSRGIAVDSTDVVSHSSDHIDPLTMPDRTFDSHVNVVRLGNLNISVNVPATVTIDGTQVTTDATSYTTKLAYNQEISYEISASGYLTQTGTYTYSDNTFQNKTLEITLQPE